MNLSSILRHSLTVLIASFVLFNQVAYSQGTPSLAIGGARAAMPAVAPDPLKRDTPRSAIYGLLEACHASKFDLAAQYLDLRRIRPDLRTSQGAQLAQQLGTVLDRDTKFEVAKLSNAPAGSTEDGLPTNLERLDTFEVNQQTITLDLQRQQVNGQKSLGRFR